MSDKPIEQSIGADAKEKPDITPPNELTGAVRDAEPKLTEMLSTITRLTEEVRDAKGEIKNTQNISHLGFVILLVMVAAIIIQSFVQWSSAYLALNENVIRLQLHLEKLDSDVVLKNKPLNNEKSVPLTSTGSLQSNTGSNNFRSL